MHDVSHLAYFIHALVSSWNQTILNNVDKAYGSKKQRHVVEVDLSRLEPAIYRSQVKRFIHSAKPLTIVQIHVSDI